jgi:hypothetical protein
MASSLVTVPDNMSYVNAFRALWEHSKPAVYFDSHPEQLQAQEATVSTSEKVVHFFKELNGTYVDYAGERLIKTDFRKFPELSVYGYDQKYGIGSAHKVLSHYDQIPSSRRFDQNDNCRFSEIPKKLVSKL